MDGKTAGRDEGALGAPSGSGQEGLQRRRGLQLVQSLQICMVRRSRQNVGFKTSLGMCYVFV